MTQEPKNLMTISKPCFLGFDIGSTSLNTVIMDEDHNILEDYYDYVHGKPFNVLKSKLDSIIGRITPGNLKGIAVTGTGGKLATERSFCK